MGTHTLKFEVPKSEYCDFTGIFRRRMRECGIDHEISVNNECIEVSMTGTTVDIVNSIIDELTENIHGIHIINRSFNDVLF